MKVATRPELFPYSEVIGWILPKADVMTMILENTAKQGYAAYSPFTFTTGLPNRELVEGGSSRPGRNCKENDDTRK